MASPDGVELAKSIMLMSCARDITSSGRLILKKFDASDTRLYGCQQDQKRENEDGGFLGGVIG